MIAVFKPSRLILSPSAAWLRLPPVSFSALTKSLLKRFLVISRNVLPIVHIAGCDHHYQQLAAIIDNKVDFEAIEPAGVTSKHVKLNRTRRHRRNTRSGSGSDRLLAEKALRERPVATTPGTVPLRVQMAPGSI